MNQVGAKVQLILRAAKTKRFNADVRLVLSGSKVRLFCEQPLPDDPDGAIALQIALREHRGVGFYVHSLVDDEMKELHLTLFPITGDSGWDAHYVCATSDWRCPSHPQWYPPDAYDPLIELRYRGRQQSGCKLVVPVRLAT